MYDTDWDGEDWRAGMTWEPDWTPDEDFVTRNNRLLEYREFDGLDPNAAQLFTSLAVAVSAIGVVITPGNWTRRATARVHTR